MRNPRNQLELCGDDCTVLTGSVDGDTVALVGVVLAERLDVHRVRVPDLEELAERLEDEDEADEHSEALLREPRDVANLTKATNRE